MKWIYLINIESTDIYKIGVTQGKPQNRLINLQVGNPYKLALTTTYHSKYGNMLEGILHRTYQLHKVSDERNLLGEWFELNREQVLGFQVKCKEIEDRLDYLKENSTLDKF